MQLHSNSVETVNIGDIMSKRDYTKYELVKNREVVYRGITNDFDRRVSEHKQNKKFDSARVVGRSCTEQGAKKWEEKSLETYRKNHGGQNPKYNKTEKG